MITQMNPAGEVNLPLSSVAGVLTTVHVPRPVFLMTAPRNPERDGMRGPIPPGSRLRATGGNLLSIASPPAGGTTTEGTTEGRTAIQGNSLPSTKEAQLRMIAPEASARRA
ncbi:MAG: hypothetical protein LBG44_03810 [Gemmatimonadota bacterium]|jgi:hypothetical protein|nr:hypothetical protein [Gemmatimonadota bacterium]